MAFNNSSLIMELEGGIHHGNFGLSYAICSWKNPYYCDLLSIPFQSNATVVFSPSISLGFD